MLGKELDLRREEDLSERSWRVWSRLTDVMCPQGFTLTLNPLPSRERRPERGAPFLIFPSRVREGVEKKGEATSPLQKDRGLEVCYGGYGSK